MTIQTALLGWLYVNCAGVVAWAVFAALVGCWQCLREAWWSLCAWWEARLAMEERVRLETRRGMRLMRRDRVLGNRHPRPKDTGGPLDGNCAGGGLERAPDDNTGGR